MSLHFENEDSRPSAMWVNTDAAEESLYFSNGEKFSFEKMSGWAWSFLEKEISEELRRRINLEFSKAELTQGYNVFEIRIKFWPKFDELLDGIPMRFHELAGMELRTDAVLVLIRYWLTNVDLVSEDDPRLKFLDDVLKTSN